jgi:hypothetical protein
VIYWLLRLCHHMTSPAWTRKSKMRTIEQRDGDGDSVGGEWGDGDDDSMENDEDEDTVLEEDDGWGQEEEEEEEKHVDVTNFLYRLNRRVTPPLPPES